MSDAIDYPSMVLRALRSVAREALAQAAEEGLPGEHHFYLTFRTGDPGVSIPRHLRESYPETITIVLQHQFWNLEVDDEAFSVTLRFGGRPAGLVVPFAALTEFADPAASFGLRLEPPRQPAESVVEEPERRRRATPETGEPDAGPGAANVVSMDSFRKKKPSA